MKNTIKKLFVALISLFFVISIFNFSYADDNPINEINPTEEENLNNEDLTSSDQSIVEKNVYVTSGEDTTIDYPISGDLYICCGGTVTISSYVYGNVFVVANKLAVANSAYFNSLYSVSSELEFSGVLDGNMYAVAKTFNQNPNSIIWRDLYLVSQNATINGDVERDINLSCETLQIKDSAYIGRDLNYVSKTQADVSESASINGKINFTQSNTEEDTNNEISNNKLSIASNIEDFIISTLKYLIIAFVIFFLLKWIVPSAIEKSTNSLKSKPGKLAGYGAIALFLTPIATLILMFTIIGIPVSVLLLAMYVIAIILSTKFSIIALSNLFVNKYEDKWNCKPLVKQLVTILVIVLIYRILKLIPFVGFILTFAMGFFGLGIIADLIIPNKKKTDSTIKEKESDSKPEIKE